MYENILAKLYLPVEKVNLNGTKHYFKYLICT